MYRNVSQKFTGGCFLLVRQKEDSVVFLGTAFLIHEDGYLLTASHLVGNDFEGLMIAKPSNPEDFSPLSLDNVHAISVDVVKVDYKHNTAVLKFKHKISIETPDHLVGVVDNVFLGSDVLCLGFPFGHNDMHNLGVQRSMISSKVNLREESNLFLLDTPIHMGMAGGPLVNCDDSRVIGILVGRFLPSEEGGDFVRNDIPDFETSFSYAVSIEYARAILEEEGVDLF